MVSRYDSGMDVLEAIATITACLVILVLPVSVLWFLWDEGGET